jgi:hypothetical protein
MAALRATERPASCPEALGRGHWWAPRRPRAVLLAVRRGRVRLRCRVGGGAPPPEDCTRRHNARVCPCTPMGAPAQRTPTPTSPVGRPACASQPLPGRAWGGQRACLRSPTPAALIDSLGARPPPRTNTPPLIFFLKRICAHAAVFIDYHKTRSTKLTHQLCHHNHHSSGSITDCSTTRGPLPEQAASICSCCFFSFFGRPSSSSKLTWWCDELDSTTFTAPRGSQPLGGEEGAEGEMCSRKEDDRTSETKQRKKKGKAKGQPYAGFDVLLLSFPLFVVRQLGALCTRLGIIRGLWIGFLSCCGGRLPDSHGSSACRISCWLLLLLLLSTLNPRRIRAPPPPSRPQRPGGDIKSLIT